MYLLVIQFIEKRFNVSCPNISPWRRAVSGDLLSAFNFDSPDYSWPDLPDTRDYAPDSIEECLTLPYPVVPSSQAMPKQEPGTRISRALPYQFETADKIDSSSSVLSLDIHNTGAAGSFFALYDLLDPSRPVRKYTVEAGRSLTAPIPLPSEGSGAYAYSLLGPNGFFRQLKGSKDCVVFTASISYLPSDQLVVVTFSNTGETEQEFLVTDNAYGSSSKAVLVSAGGMGTLSVDVSPSGNWYDLSVTLGSSASCFSRRFGGRMETGQDSISDPAMGNGVPDVGPSSPSSHPAVPEPYRIMSYGPGHLSKTANHKDAFHMFEVKDFEHF
jgi:phospholipase C